MSRDKLLPGLPLPFVNCIYVTRDTLGAESKWVILEGHGGHMILFLAIFLVAMVIDIPASSNPRMTNVGVIVSYYIGFTHVLYQRPFIQVHVHRKVSKAFDMRIFYFFIYILFFQMTKRKNNPLRPKGKQKNWKILVTRYISHEMSRPSNDEMKHNPPSTQTKKGTIILLPLLTRYISPRKVPGKREKTSSYDVDGLKTNYRTTWM